MLTPDMDGAPRRDETRSGSRPPRRSSRALAIVRRVASSLILYPRYRLLWFSNLFFFSGVWTQTLVLGWLVFEITHSELSVAIFTAARFAPLVFGPLAGLIADRVNRVRLLEVASAWAFFTMAAIAILVSLDLISFWGLVLGGFCIGMAQSPSQPARFTLVFNFVGRESLSNANALNTIVTNLTQVIGPAVGGAMIAAFGVAAALWISAFWYLASLVALWPLRGVETGPGESADETLSELLASGLKAISSNRLATAVLSITFAANTFLWPIYGAFMPVFAKVRLGLDAEGLGWLLTCAGTGGFIGSLGIAAFGDFKFKGGIFVVGTAIWGLLWAAFSLSSSVPLSFVLMTFIGLAAAPFVVMQTTLLLMMTDPGKQGRVMGMQELTIGIMPISTVILGVAAELIGITATAFINGLLMSLFVACVVAWAPPLLRYTGRQA